MKKTKERKADLPKPEDDIFNMDSEEATDETGTTYQPNIWSTYTPTSNRLDIFRFLTDNGWTITKSTFYRHIDGGRLRKNREGLYTQLAVKKYAQTWAVRSSGGPVAKGMEDLMEEKVQAETDRIKVIKAREAFRLDVEQGKYILKEKMDHPTKAYFVS